jgi:hypothetical protein
MIVALRRFGRYKGLAEPSGSVGTRNDSGSVFDGNGRS